MLPNFVVIGAQKAGSTFVQNALQDHPDVYMPFGETPFFQDPDYSQQSLADLERLFVGHTDRRALGIKRPNYLNQPEVPPRIATDLPGVRLIAVLRNPVERAVSGYFHYMKSRFIPIRPLNDGLRDLIAGRYDDRVPLAREVLSNGLYHQHLERYTACFDHEQLLILLFDDIRADSAAVMRRCYRFLGIDEDYRPGTLDSRPMAATYSLTRLRLGAFLQTTYMRLDPDRRRIHYRRGPLAAGCRCLFGGLDRYAWSRLFHERKPALDPDLAEQLIEYYRADVTALGTMLGKDLSHWLKPRVAKPAA